jgi:hypothetical protein
MKQAYKISIDTAFQDYLPDMPESESGRLYNRWLGTFKSFEPVASWLGRFPVFIRSPQLPASDFFDAPMIGRFGISEKVNADTVMRAMLEAAGELLPMEIPDSGKLIYSFNPLRTARKDGLVDMERCEKKLGRISKIAFHNDRLPDGGLFTISEYLVAVYAVHSPELPPESDFVQWYRRQGYRGLKLTEAEKAWM